MSEDKKFRELTFSEKHENYSIDDYINEGDIGPWYSVIALEALKEVERERDELKEKLQERDSEETVAYLLGAENSKDKIKDLEEKLGVAVKLLEAVDHLVSDEGKEQLTWREHLQKLQSKGLESDG